MLVKRPRRNYDDDVYYYLEFSYNSYACYSIFIYSPDVYLCLFLWFSALPDLPFYVNSAVCLLCHDVAEVAHCLMNTTNIPSWG